MISPINILDKLIKQRDNAISSEDLLASFKQILNEVDVQRNSTLSTLNSANVDVINHFNVDVINSNNIFHISQIKKICADYRLRFLDSVYFKEPYPEEAITKIHEIELEHNTKLANFKIVAPFEAFKLKKADDPLLFAPMGNGYYYLIHKWGTDLHPLRKLKYWSFKNIDNLLVAMTLLSVLFTWLTYPFFFKQNPSFGYLLMLCMFYFKGIAGMFFIFFGGTGKNFSEYAWQSQYDKIH